jgi:hypothetical protein
MTIGNVSSRLKVTRETHDALRFDSNGKESAAALTAVEKAK